MARQTQADLDRMHQAHLDRLRQEAAEQAARFRQTEDAKRQGTYPTETRRDHYTEAYGNGG